MNLDDYLGTQIVPKRSKFKKFAQTVKAILYAFIFFLKIIFLYFAKVISNLLKDLKILSIKLIIKYYELKKKIIIKKIDKLEKIKNKKDGNNF